MSFRPPRMPFSQSWARHALGHSSSWGQRVLAIGICLTCAGLLALEFDVWSHRHRQDLHRLDLLQEQVSQLGLRKTPPPPPEVHLTVEQIEHHNRAVRQLNLPWSDIFDGLERHVDTDIALMAIEPDTNGGLLRVQAEGRSIDTLLVYAQHLAADPSFSDLLLHQHETNEQDPNHPARLTFDVRLSAAQGSIGARP